MNKTKSLRLKNLMLNLMYKIVYFVKCLSVLKFNY